jgi:hypothetical protein
VPNVTVRPRVSRAELTGLVAAADVGLIPHLRTELTEAMSPLKLYEYLAAGLPVAAVDLPGIAGVCRDRTRLAPAGVELPVAVEGALALGRWAEEERRGFIAENAWSRRFEGLLDVAFADETPPGPDPEGEA